MVFLLRPPALRSIPYARQRTSSVGQSLVPTRLDRSPESSLNADPRAGAIRRRTPNRARTNRRYFSHSFPRALVVFRVIASAPRPAHHAAAGFRFPRDVRRAFPRVLEVHHRFRRRETPGRRGRVVRIASRPSRSFRFVSLRTILCVSSRDAERRMGRGRGKALCVRAGARAVEIVRHQCKI